MNNWISVKDKLPPKAGDYLVFCQWPDDDYCIDVEHYTKKGGFENFSDAITHWMFLPEPPQQ